MPPFESTVLVAFVCILCTQLATRVEAQEAACPDASLGCSECLTADCAWTAGLCLDSCQIADVSCFRAVDFPDLSVEAVCEIDATQNRDNEICQTPVDCSSCVSTIKSDGTTNCEWYSEIGFCGIGGCGLGGCGSSVCPGGLPCESASTCQNCLDMSCSWTGGQCFEDCVIADASCYNTENFGVLSTVEICESAEEPRQGIFIRFLVWLLNFFFSQ